MIEFHESEYSHFALSDLQMMQVAFLLGPECVTKLLYSGDKNARLYRLDPARDRPAPQERTHRDDDSGPFDIWHTPADQESETVATAEALPSLARSG